MSQRTITYTRCPVPTAFGLAVRLGFIDEELAHDGLKLQSIQQSADRKTIESHYTHALPDSFRHGGNTPAIWARARGADSRIIGLSWTHQPHYLLTLPGSGIASPADLKGRRLGVSRRKHDLIDFYRGSTLRAYEVALKSAGLTFADVTLVELEDDRDRIAERIDAQTNPSATFPRRAPRSVGWRTETNALIRGDIDVIYAQSAHGTHTKNLLGAQVVYDVSEHPDWVERANNALPEAFTVSGRLIDEEPELVARVVAQTIRAAEWAKTHRQETVRLIGLEQSLSEQVIEENYGPKLAERLGITLCDGRIAALSRRKQWLLENGFLAQDFDVNAWIDRRPLERALQILQERASAGEPVVAGATTLQPAGVANCAL